MKRLVDAVYRGGQVEPLEPLDLPDKTRVQILVEQATGEVSDSGDDPLARLWEIAEDIGPPDLASNLDSYLYGSNDRR